MARVSAAELRTAVAKWRDITKLPLTVDGANGGYRIELETYKGGCRVLSPRMSPTKLREWFDAFIQGWEYGSNRVEPPAAPTA